MKKKFKKAAAGALAAVALMTSVLSLGASAYSDSGTWQFYANSNVSTPFYQNYKLNYYSGGYRAVITSKSYGGAYNYVKITEVDENKNVVTRVTLTEVGTLCKIFKSINPIKDTNGDYYAAFTARMYAEDTASSTTASNYGKIGVSNIF